MATENRISSSCEDEWPDDDEVDPDAPATLADERSSDDDDDDEAAMDEPAAKAA